MIVATFWMPPLNNCKVCSAVLFCILFTTQLAYGLTVNFNGSLGTLADAALDRAAAQWTSRISDPIMVTIDVSFATFAPNIIGQASSVTLTTTNDGFDFVRGALITDAAGEADDTIVASLPTAAQFTPSVLMPAGITFNGELLGSKANFKALEIPGLDLDGPFGLSDGTIQFNDLFNFDFDNINGVSGTDFETVAAHEIGHILGFQSAVDAIDSAVDQGLTGTIGVFMLDLFRFGSGSAPTTAAAFTTTGRELRPNAEAVFGDTDDNYRLSTGAFTGDGRQASHFKDDSLLGIHLGIMDPTLANNVSFDVTEADLRVLDLIGWDVAPIPLPPAFLLFGSACGLLVFLRI